MKFSFQVLMLIGFSLFIFGIIIDAARRKKRSSKKYNDNIEEDLIQKFELNKLDENNNSYASFHSNSEKNKNKNDNLTTFGFSEFDSDMDTDADLSKINAQLDSETPLTIAISILTTSPNKFVGYELLQALLSAGLRFGEMNIFHRYENLNGRGKILFSLACATKPGTFDINNMGGFSCQGLTLFLREEDLDNIQTNFELMLGTARQLAEDLGGELYDSLRQVLTQQTIRSYREQIRNKYSSLLHQTTMSSIEE